MKLPDIQSTFGGIYQIRNLINGNLYVGSTNKLRKRANQHRYELEHSKHYSPYLQKAWKKHGQQCFVFEIVELVVDDEQLLQREQHYIDLLNPKYNICPVAGSAKGRVTPPEVREKLRLANLGKPHSPERIANITIGRNTAWVLRPELKEIARKNATGKRQSEETKHKHGETMKKLRREQPWRWPIETRKCNSPEATKKRSESLKKSWERRKRICQIELSV